MCGLVQNYASRCHYIKFIVMLLLRLICRSRTTADICSGFESANQGTNTTRQCLQWQTYQDKGRFHLHSRYHRRTNITRGLYIFCPIFEDQFFVFKDVFYENSDLMYGQYSRAVCNQERVIMARILYTIQYFRIQISW